MKQRDEVILFLVSSVDEDRLTTAKIVTITSSLATLMPFLPYEYIGQDRFPVFIQTGNRSFFHVFVVYLMISFATSFSALYLLRKYPNAAKFCKNFSITCLMFAMAFAAFCFL